jgi:hypothetical protein
MQGFIALSVSLRGVDVIDRYPFSSVVAVIFATLVSNYVQGHNC